MDERARKRRLFVGIELAPETRTRCAAVAEDVRRTGLIAKYEAPEKLHVTLAFLGFVEPARFDAVVGSLAAGRHIEPLRVSLDKLGAFPHERRPRIAYVGARKQGPAFQLLARRVRSAYAELGFEFRDDPVAHVTIARIKESKRPLPLVEFAPIALEIRELSLFESFPDPANKTSRYEIVARAPLSR